MKTIFMYLIVLLGSLNRLRGTWGWWAKVNAVIYAVVVYVVYSEHMRLDKTYEYATMVLGWINYLIGLSFNFIVNMPSIEAFSIAVVTSMCFLGYIIGEMAGWGLWVGVLVNKIRDTWYMHTEREGGGYTGIQRLAEYWIEPTRENWIDHCRLALTLRGLWWSSWMLIPLALVGVNLSILVLAMVLLAVSFPIACDIGEVIARYSVKVKIWFLEASGGWEWQEIIYGVIQVIVLLIVIGGSLC